MKVLIAIPTVGNMDSDFFRAYTQLQRPPGWGVAIVDRLVVHLARNQLCSIMLEGDWTHILFWDDDVLPPLDSLNRMLAHDKDIVMTPIVNRQARFLMCYRDGKEYRGEGLEMVDSGSMGFVLIKREVVEKLFKKYNGYPFDFTEREEGKPHGEDIVFMERANREGFEVWCDFEISPMHLGRKQRLTYRKT